MLYFELPSLSNFYHFYHLVVEILKNTAPIPYQELKIHLIQLMVQISDGESVYNFIQIQGSTVTTLEYAHFLLCHLMTFVPRKKYEITNLKLKTLEQVSLALLKSCFNVKHSNNNHFYRKFRIR